MWFSVSGDVDEYRAELLRRETELANLKTDHLVRCLPSFTPGAGSCLRCMRARLKIGLAMAPPITYRLQWPVDSCSSVTGNRLRFVVYCRANVRAFYSPRSQLRAGVPVQSFTAIGRVRDREPYLYPQTPSFSPTRRDVTYFKAQAAPIEPLLGELLVYSSWGRIWHF